MSDREENMNRKQKRDNKTLGIDAMSEGAKY